MDPKFNISSIDASHLLTGLVAVNRAQIKRAKAKGMTEPFPIIKAIQAGKLRYKRQDKEEHWQTWDEMMKNINTPKFAGTIEYGADCEDLSSAVAAELLEAGIPARTYVYKSRPKLFHVVVLTNKWGFLDPSRDAGMSGNG
jgi:hypothetical protein